METQRFVFLHIGDATHMLEHDVICVVENEERVRIPRVAQIQTLGAVLHQCGRIEGTVDEHFVKAKRSFFSGSHYLRNPRIVSPLKFARYKRDVLTVAVFGCGAWTLSQCLLARLVCFENTVLRFMTRCPRKTDARGKLEPFISWRRRHTASARRLFHSNVKFVQICEVYLGRMFGFACKLFRGSLTVEVLVMRDIAIWRNQFWWKSVQTVGEKKRRILSPEWRHAIVGKKTSAVGRPVLFCLGT